MSTAPTRRVHRVTAWISVTAVWSARVLRERGLCLGVLLRRDAASSPVEDAMRAMSAWFWVEAATLRWVARWVMKACISSARMSFGWRFWWRRT